LKRARHAHAAAPLKFLLTQDRNEPAGVLALGALYLHTGSFVRASQEFARARGLSPNDPLAAFGAALADLALRRGDPAGAFARIPGDAVPAASLVAAYARLLAGDAAPFRDATSTVSASEPDPFRLQLAAFAALRAGDKDRAATLLAALLARPGMGRLAEDRALVLPFEADRPVEGGAPTLLSAIEFPAPSRAALSGRVSLTPGASVPPGTAWVAYSIPGDWMNAGSNAQPFAAEWNTTQVPNGLYTLRTICYDGSGRPLRETTRTVRVANAGAGNVLTGRLSGEQREAARRRLLALLTPRPARKAAHFVLA
jgi:tetratricopeptide (TPR) repeat protein